MNVEQKKFIGYAVIDSEVKPMEEFNEIKGKIILTKLPLEKPLAFRVKWLARNPITYDDVKFIRNQNNKGS